MSKMWGRVSAAAGMFVIVGASSVLANEPKGGAPDYSGISTMYYALIGGIPKERQCNGGTSALRAANNCTSTPNGRLSI